MGWLEEHWEEIAFVAGVIGVILAALFGPDVVHYMVDQ